MTDSAIVSATDASIPTVARICNRYVQGRIQEAIDRRVPDVETLRQEVTVQERTRNDQHATVSWHFTTEHARQKVQRFFAS